MADLVVKQVFIGGPVDAAEPTIAIGFGTTDDGTVEVAFDFNGEWRPMMELGNLLGAGLGPVMDLADVRVLGVREIAKGEEG